MMIFIHSLEILSQTWICENALFYHGIIRFLKNYYILDVASLQNIKYEESHSTVLVPCSALVAFWIIKFYLILL